MKVTALKFINSVLAILLLCTVTGVFLYKFGPTAWRGSEALAEFHEVCGLLFFCVGLIHLYYNWHWVKLNIFGKKSKKSKS